MVKTLLFRMGMTRYMAGKLVKKWEVYIYRWSGEGFTNKEIADYIYRLYVGELLRWGW